MLKLSTKILASATVISTAGLFYACSEDTFSAGKKPTLASENTVTMSCASGQQGSRTTANFTGVAGMTVIVKGEFCSISVAPPEQPTTNLYFIVDFSGSMADADPLVSGSCGRLQAAKALLDKMSPASQTGATAPKINVGSTVFGSTASVSSSIKSVADFRSSELTAEKFCRSNMTGTNYQDALIKAKAQLANVQGDKMVFFISDGLPSQSNGSDSVNQSGVRGIAAADEFRAVSGMQLYGLYLTAKYDPAEYQYMGTTTPEQYMQQIVGNDPNKFKVASNASDLVNQILSLPAPPPTTIVSGSGANYFGQLEATGFNQQKFGVKMAANPTTDGKFQFTTDPIKLFYDKVGTTVMNTVRITAKSTNGSTTESVAIINFTRNE